MFVSYSIFILSHSLSDRESVGKFWVTVDSFLIDFFSHFADESSAMVVNG